MILLYILIGGLLGLVIGDSLGLLIGSGVGILAYISFQLDLILKMIKKNQ